MALNGDDVLAAIGWDTSDAGQPLSGRTGHLIAISYGEGEGERANLAISEIVRSLRRRRVTLAGVLPISVPRPDRCRCDIELEDLTTGRRVSISEDRGPEARGCKLDMRGLEEAVGLALEAVEKGADALIINRFGKAEAEGRGFRAAIAAAVERGIPVLVAVGETNVGAWQAFAGGASSIHALDDLAAAQRAVQ